jgi:hypothetical protein
MQRHISSHIALIFCLDPVFAAAWASAALGENMGRSGRAGAALILAAMVVAEAPVCIGRSRNGHSPLAAGTSGVKMWFLKRIRIEFMRQVEREKRSVYIHRNKEVLRWKRRG